MQPKTQSRTSISSALLLLILIITGTPGAVAQSMKDLQSSTPEQRAKYQTDYLTQHLKLSADQTAKVSTITLKYANQMEPIIKGNDSRLTKAKAAKASNEQKEVEYKQVFTPAQYTEYEKQKDELKSKMLEMAKEKKAESNR